MEQCLISRLGDLQCLPSYLYTCVGNQIRQSQKEPFHTASSPSLVLAHHGLSILSHPYDVVGPALGLMQMCRVSEYACRLRLIVSQTQVDFKAGEYIDPAYIAYVQEEVTKATLQEAEAQEITEIGRRNICSGDEPDQIRKGEGSAGNNDHHYVLGLPVEHPMPTIIKMFHAPNGLFTKCSRACEVMSDFMLH